MPDNFREKPFESNLRLEGMKTRFEAHRSAEEEVNKVMVEWRAALEEAIRNRGETGIVMEKYLPLYERAREKAVQAFDAWLASIKE